MRAQPNDAIHDVVRLRQHEDRRVTRGTDPACEFESALIRHVDVDDQQVGHALGEAGVHLAVIAGGDGGIAWRPR
jgi:hypothetical protein